MTKRTQEDWQKIIEQQTESQLTIANFCKQHDLSQSYFYKIKSELHKFAGSAQKTTFIKVSKPVINVSQSRTITLEYQQTRISLPVDISPLWLAEFIRDLT